MQASLFCSSEMAKEIYLNMKERTEGTVDQNKICAHLSIAFCCRLCLHFLLCVNIFLIFFLEVLIF